MRAKNKATVCDDFRRIHSIAATVPLICVITLAAIAAQSSGVAMGTLADAEAYLKRGEAFAGAKRYDLAIADYNMAIRLKPGYAEAYNDRGHAYHWKGGDGDRALADFTRAIELRHNYPTAYNNRGVVYMAGGHAARAIPEFDRALQLNPNLRNAYVNRAMRISGCSRSAPRSTTSIVRACIPSGAPPCSAAQCC